MKQHILQILVSIGLITALFISTARSDEQLETIRSEAKKLAVTISLNTLSGQNLDHFVGFLRGQVPDVPEEIWSDAIKGLSQPSEESSVMVKMLEENFTAEELSELNRLFTSKVQKKFQEKMSGIANDLMMEQLLAQKEFLGRLIVNLESKGQDATALKKTNDQMPLSSVYAPKGIPIGGSGQTPGITAK